MCFIRTKWKWVYKELRVKFQHVIRGSMECSIAAASWDKIIANVWVGIRIPEVLISFYLKSNSRSKLPASAVQDCIRRSNFIKIKWMRLVLIFGCPCPWPWEMILKRRFTLLLVLHIFGLFQNSYLWNLESGFTLLSSRSSAIFNVF